MVRTRSGAAALTQSGHVRVNGTRVIATSHLLRRGDVVTLALDRSVRLLRVESFSERRGDASAARRLYHLEAEKS
jgi:ribosome-associated heat shock protein Hsp15